MCKITEKRFLIPKWNPNNDGKDSIDPQTDCQQYVLSQVVYMVYLIAVGAICLAFTSQVTAATYYVDVMGGNDDNNGLSPSMAWASIGKVNDFVFLDGDTVCLKRGEVYRDEPVRVYHLPDNFTLRDYGSGPKPWINGNIVRPISIEPSSRKDNLVIMNIDISGQDWFSGKSTNLSVDNINNLIIDGVIGDGYKGRSGFTIGKNAITIRGGCIGDIEIKNCSLENWGLRDLLSPPRDYMGITILKVTNANTTIFIHNNIIHNISADAIHLHNNNVSAYIFENTLYNCGEDCIDLKGSSNNEIHNNELYREPGFVGDGGSGSGGWPTLIDLHEYEGMVARNNIIRDNYFHGGDVAAIKPYRVDGLDIYRNTIEYSAIAMRIGNYCKDVHFFNNIVRGTYLFENNAYSGTKIHDNIFHESFIDMKSCNQTDIRNNIIYSYNPDLYLLTYTHGTFPTVTCNLWHNPESEKRILWKKVRYDVSDYNLWLPDHPGDLFYDPLFADRSFLRFAWEEFPQTIDIQEGFETGDFSVLSWFNKRNWFIDDHNPHTGVFSARSMPIADRESCSMGFIFDAKEDFFIEFACKTSTEAEYDFLRFYIDGTVTGSWSGDMEWTQVAYKIEPGAHEFRWEYAKDVNVSSLDDSVWVDDISLFLAGELEPAGDSEQQ